MGVCDGSAPIDAVIALILLAGGRVVPAFGFGGSSDRV